MATEIITDAFRLQELDQHQSSLQVWLRKGWKLVLPSQDSETGPIERYVAGSSVEAKDDWIIEDGLIFDFVLDLTHSPKISDFALASTTDEGEYEARVVLKDDGSVITRSADTAVGAITQLWIAAWDEGLVDTDSVDAVH